VTRLEVKITEYPEQVTQPGTYTIKNVKPPQETRYGLTLILIATNTKGEERSLFVPYASETSKRTNLARLIEGFGNDTDQWINKRIHVTLGTDNKRTIEPATK